MVYQGIEEIVRSDPAIVVRFENGVSVAIEKREEEIAFAPLYARTWQLNCMKLGSRFTGGFEQQDGESDESYSIRKDAVFDQYYASRSKFSKEAVAAIEKYLSQVPTPTAKLSTTAADIHARITDRLGIVPVRRARNWQHFKGSFRKAHKSLPEAAEAIDHYRGRSQARTARSNLEAIAIIGTIFYPLLPLLEASRLVRPPVIGRRITNYDALNSGKIGEDPAVFVCSNNGTADLFHDDPVYLFPDGKRLTSNQLEKDENLTFLGRRYTESNHYMHIGKVLENQLDKALRDFDTACETFQAFRVDEDQLIEVLRAEGYVIP